MKNHLRRRLAGPALVLSALALAACASSVVYGPADAGAAFGYTEQKIEDGRYRLSYRGRDGVQSSDGALRRAAELTVADGAEWFEVVSRDREAEGSGSGPRVGVGGSVGSGDGWSGSAVGIGVTLPVGGARGAVTERLEIRTGKGAKPDTGTVYDAADVLDNLR